MYAPDPRYHGTGEPIVSYNPSTGEAIGQVNGFTVEEAQSAVTRARKAQEAWRDLDMDERIRILRQFQHVLTKRADEVCRLIAAENGKPLQEAMQTEVFPVLMLADYFLKRGKKILADQPIPIRLLKYRRSFLTYRPRGVMLIISPWNYPFSIPGGTILMGLLAGNAVVHKPASLTPLIALKTRELFDDAGLDPDLYQVVPGPGALGSRMIGMGVDHVNFTGSTEVGLKVAEACSRRLIPNSMELGGKDPAIVLKDADLDQAAGAIVFGALTNAGQTCSSVERVYVHEKVYDDLVGKITRRVKALRVGDPFAAETDMGPLKDARQIDIVAAQVEDAVRKGARILAGGERLPGPGQFFAPTVLVDVTDDMQIMQEETFGPTIPIMKVASADEAVAKANDSPYGLNAYVFSTNAERARQIARRLEAGTVMVNEALITFGIPETPWQGVKMSGTGRTHSDEGLRSLCYPYHINEEGLFRLPVNPFWQPYSRKMYRRFLAVSRLYFGAGILKHLRDGLPGLLERPPSAGPRGLLPGSGKERGGDK